MTFLPIVARELRVTSRKARTYWSRTGVAAVMLMLASWVFVMSHSGGSSTQAVAMFGTLAGALLVVGGISGIGATADSISSEKRDGTLGFLFLTPLRGYDVVLGKLCAGSLNVLYGLAAVTPIMALPLLLGGVSPWEFARMALLMLNTMLFSLSTGIFVSSISRDEKRARAATLLVVMLFAGGFPILGALMEFEWKISGAAKYCMLFSPGYAFACAWERGGSLSLSAFWTSMTTIHLLSWIFLGLACWFTPRTWQDRPARGRTMVGAAKKFIPSRIPDEAVAFRRRLLDQNAFYWLTSRPRIRPALAWVGVLAITFLWLGFGLKYFRNDMFEPTMLVFVAVAWNGVLKAWCASEATRQIALDRKSGSIELLLSTPLTLKDISGGLWLALRRQFGSVVLSVCVAEIIFMFLGLGNSNSGSDRASWVAVWIILIAMLLCDLIALYAVGLWQSAVAKGPAEAAGAVGFRILALPWILYMAFAAIIGMTVVAGITPSIRGAGWVFWLGSWSVIAFGVNAFFGIRAWRAFHSRFREVVTRPPAQTGWKRALKWLVGGAHRKAQANS